MFKMCFLSLIVAALTWIPLVTSAFGRKPENCFTNHTLECIEGRGTCKSTHKTRGSLAYSCHCKPEFCGLMCQEDNVCLAWGIMCLHKGRCLCRGRYKEDINFVCRCRKPFKGRRCEILPDAENPCLKSNDCPPGTNCVPDIVERLKEKQVFVLVYSCLDNTSGRYVVKNLDPKEERTQSYTNQTRKCTKRQSCDHGGSCVNQTCVKESRKSVTVSSDSLDRVCEINVGAVWAGLNITGNEFDDIDVSGIDDYLLNDLLKTNLKLQHPDSRDVKSQRGKKIVAKRRNRFFKTSAMNPCRFGARCLPIAINDYRCFCPHGTSGKNCSVGCPVGKHGPNCSRWCGQCERRGCDVETGSCGGRCLPGFRGARCNARHGLAVSMTTILSGPFDKALTVVTSQQYSELQSVVTNWIVPLCAKQLGLPCSVYQLQVRLGSVALSYDVMLESDELSMSVEGTSSRLANILKNNTGSFNSSLYQIVRQSIKIEKVQTFYHHQEKNSARHWLWLVGLAGLYFTILPIVVGCRKCKTGRQWGNSGTRRRNYQPKRLKCVVVDI